MTKKQFTVTNISENGMKGLFKLGNDTLSIYDVARLINELLEENEQLKENYNSLSHNNGLLYDKCNDKINALKKENELLKQQLRHLEYRFTEYRIKLGDVK